MLYNNWDRVVNGHNPIFHIPFCTRYKIHVSTLIYLNLDIDKWLPVCDKMNAFWCVLDCIADVCDKSFSWCTANAKSHIRTNCNRQCILRKIIITVLFNIVLPAISHGLLNIDMHLDCKHDHNSPDEHQQWANLFQEADDKIRISGSDQ